MRRGALIVFEGCDRSGKSTQCAKLVHFLQKEGHPVQALHFPDRSLPSGQLLNQYLSGKCTLEDHAVHLLFGANRWELVPRMLQLINSGTSLVVDRYAYSGVAFSAAKESLNLSWCQQCEVGLPKPDLVLFLDLSPEAAVLRKGYGDEVYEKVDFQTKVRHNYHLLRVQEDTWQVLNAEESAEELSQKIKELSMESILGVSEKLGKLWCPIQT